MANQEHLAILSQGVRVWNTWRKESPNICPDLRNAVLHKANLNGASLSRTFLDGADLRWTLLVGTDLRHATANATDFRWSNFSGSNLTDADLLAAHLGGACFRWTVLTRTNLESTVINETIFENVDLRDVKGLEACHHLGPSTVDLRTIRKSWPLSLRFLRGCGFPDDLIEYLPSLVGREDQFFSCFISYSMKDQEFTERLHGDLQNSGVRCWFAAHNAKGGKKLSKQISKAVHSHDRVLLILSENSMKSEWVKTEIATARRREIGKKRQMLFPIRLVPYDKIKKWKAFDADTGKDSAREIREYFIPDFSN